jgi:hypothetical protein
MHTDSNLIITILIYFLIGKIFTICLPGKIKINPSSSYYLAIMHQGYILPFLGLRHLLGYDNHFRLMFTTTFSYFLVDFFINRDIWFIDYKFVLHHLITLLLACCTIFVHDEDIYFPTMNLLCMEIGSLWLSVTDIFPTNLNYKLRFYFYVISRIINLPFNYLMIINSGFLKIYWIILSTLIYTHNLFIAKYMYKKLR